MASGVIYNVQAAGFSHRITVRYSTNKVFLLKITITGDFSQCTTECG